VNGKYVEGWDDPRMPTLSGLRRRGYTPLSMRTFCDRIGVAKFNSIVDMVVLENSIREELNKTANRVMAVLDPLKIIITNYPEDKEDLLDAVNNPEDESAGKRKVPFSREIFIERADFMEDAPKKFFRLTQGKEVRLRYAYFIKCEKAIKDETGKIIELHCTYDPETRGGHAPDGRKVKGTLHWVSSGHAKKAEVRLYEPLFTKRDPNEVEEGGDFKDNLNPDSVKVVPEALIEPSLVDLESGARVQFERIGYFCVDKNDSTKEKQVFNRIVTLKDTWAKINKK